MPKLFEFNEYHLHNPNSLDCFKAYLLHCTSFFFSIFVYENILYVVAILSSRFNAPHKGVFAEQKQRRSIALAVYAFPIPLINLSAPFSPTLRFRRTFLFMTTGNLAFTADLRESEILSSKPANGLKHVSVAIKQLCFNRVLTVLCD